jgi:hypothetical protein
MLIRHPPYCARNMRTVRCLPTHVPSSPVDAPQAIKETNGVLNIGQTFNDIEDTPAACVGAVVRSRPSLLQQVLKPDTKFLFFLVTGRETPSVACVVQPGNAGGFQKVFFGSEEVAIPVRGRYNSSLPRPSILGCGLTSSVFLCFLHHVYL